MLLCTGTSFPGAAAWVHSTGLLSVLSSGGSLPAPEPLGLSTSGSSLGALEGAGACRALELLGNARSEPLTVVAERLPSEAGPGPGLEALSPCGWVPGAQAVGLGGGAVPAGKASWGSSSVWMELFCHRVPPGSPSRGEAVVARGPVGVGRDRGPAGGGMGFQGSCPGVGGPLPLNTGPRPGARGLRLDGHCWRPHRARLLGFLATSQGSSWFLAQVTLRVRTPPPQDTEHCKRGTG